MLLNLFILIRIIVSGFVKTSLVGPLVGENLVTSKRVLGGITLDHFQFG